MSYIAHRYTEKVKHFKFIVKCVKFSNPKIEFKIQGYSAEIFIVT